MSFGQPRLIDPRGHRFGAAFSVVLLVLAFVLGQPIIVAAVVAVFLGVSAWFGTRYSVLGRPWPYVRRLFRIGPPRELEVEWPPRFAQAIGFLVLAVATVLFLVGLTHPRVAVHGRRGGAPDRPRGDRLLPGLPSVLPELEGARACSAASHGSASPRRAWSDPEREASLTTAQSMTTFVGWAGSMRTGTRAPGSARPRATSGIRLPVCTS